MENKREKNQEGREEEERKHDRSKKIGNTHQSDDSFLPFLSIKTLQFPFRRQVFIRRFVIFEKRET